MSTTPPPPPPPRPPSVPGSAVPSADPPERGAPPRSGRRAVVVLSALSIVLAMALVATSIAWWRARDASADQAAPLPSTEAAPRSPATTATPGTAPRAGDGGEPAPDRPEQGEAPDQPGPTAEGDVLDELGRMLDDLLNGDLGDLGGLGDELGNAGALSPECLGGGLDDLLGSALGGDELSGPLDDQVRDIADRVQERRGLRFDRPVEPVLLPADDFDRRIADTVAAEYPASRADADSRVLALLGVLPAGTDLRALQSDLLAGQVAGFYDPETGEIVVRDDGDGALDTTEEMTLAHELDHALTDQALGLPDVGADGHSDGDLARLALVEGDATLLMQQYALAHVGLLDQLGQLADPALRTAQADLEDVAPYLREELTFPYLAGAAYVCRMYADGGWATVDAAYDTLPATTAEVLDTDRAGTAPVDPADPGRLPAPWTVAHRDTIGVAQLGWLFGAPGSDEDLALADADARAAAWAGGELVLATRGDDSALGVALVDRGADGTLCAAVDQWYERSFDGDDRRLEDGDVVYEGPGQSAVLRCADDDVRLGIGPDVATATALVD